MNEKSKNILMMLAAAFLGVVIYIFFHEGGHALITLLCGGKITAFSIIGAYTSSTGGSYNAVTSSLLYAAGMLFPLILSFCYMLFYKKEKENVFYHFLSFYFAIIPTGSLLAWVFVPITYLSGTAPVADDVTKFLNASGIQPVIVIISAVMLFLLNVFLVWHKRIIQNWWKILNKK